MLYKVTYTELTFCYHVSETSNVDTMCETTFDIMAIKLLEKILKDGFCVQKSWHLEMYVMDTGNKCCL